MIYLFFAFFLVWIPGQLDRFFQFMTGAAGSSRRLIQQEKGVSLVEAIIAAFLLVISAIIVSEMFPKSSQLVVANRAHMQGNELANTALQNIVSQPSIACQICCWPDNPRNPPSTNFK